MPPPKPKPPPTNNPPKRPALPRHAVWSRRIEEKAEAAVREGGSKRSAPNGFTLIEVLIAVALLAGALVVLAEGYANTLNALRAGEDKQNWQQDIAFVRERILRIETLELLESGGTLETLTSGPARWEAELRPTNILDLHQLRFTIDFLDLDRIVRQEVTVLRPQWSEAADREDLLQEKREDLDQARFRKDWAN